MSRARILACLLLAACLLPAVAAPCPEPLRIGFTDRAAPPGLLGEGSQFQEPPGWAVEALRETLSHLGCRAQLLRLPMRRLSGELAQSELDFALFFGVTAERLRSYRFPRDAQGRPDTAWAPFFGHLALYGRAGSAVDPGWDGLHLAPHWRVGVLSGSAQAALAAQRGWTTVNIPAFDREQAMLQAQRFDLLLTPREVLTPAQRAELVEWAPPAALLPYFAPAAPAFAERHAAWTQGFWAELCRVVRQHQTQGRPLDCGQRPAGATLPLQP